MSRINIGTSAQNDTSMSGVECISIRTTPEKADVDLLKMLMMIAVKVSGGEQSQVCERTKAALCSLGLIAKCNDQMFSQVVMMLCTTSTAFMPDHDFANSEFGSEMPKELQEMRDKIKESILEARKRKAEQDIKNNQAQ
jgi:hypothetical protein